MCVTALALCAALLIAASCAVVLGFEDGDLRQPDGAGGAGGHGGGGRDGVGGAGAVGAAGGNGGTGGMCVPATCQALGAECGMLPDDGCGQPLDCGNDCPMGEWCGGSGNNLCGNFSCSTSWNCPNTLCGASKPACCTCNNMQGGCSLNTSACTFMSTVSTTLFYCCP